MKMDLGSLVFETVLENEDGCVLCNSFWLLSWGANPIYLFLSIISSIRPFAVFCRFKVRNLSGVSGGV